MFLKIAALWYLPRCFQQSQRSKNCAGRLICSENMYTLLSYTPLSIVTMCTSFGFFSHFFLNSQSALLQMSSTTNACNVYVLCQLMQYAPCESDILIERFTVPTSVHRSLHMLITMKNSPTFFLTCIYFKYLLSPTGSGQFLMRLNLFCKC